MARNVSDTKRENKNRMKVHKKRLLQNEGGIKSYNRPLSSDPPRLRFPPCAECGTTSELVGGRLIYPHRSDLWGRNFWRCIGCGAYVGTHRGGSGEEALGRPAGKHLRDARGKVHDLFDSLWLHAERMPEYQPFTGNPWNVRSSQRSRCYAYLRVKLNLRSEEAHTGWMDLDQCRAAYRVLMHLRPEHVRAWWKDGGEAAYYALVDNEEAKP